MTGLSKMKFTMHSVKKMLLVLMWLSLVMYLFTLEI